MFAILVAHLSRFVSTKQDLKLFKSTSHFRCSDRELSKDFHCEEEKWLNIQMSWLPYTPDPIPLWMAFHTLSISIYKSIIHYRLWYIEMNLLVSQITKVLYRHSVCKHRNKACLDWFSPNTHCTLALTRYIRLERQPAILCTLFAVIICSTSSAKWNYRIDPYVFGVFFSGFLPIINMPIFGTDLHLQ